MNFQESFEGKEGIIVVLRLTQKEYIFNLHKSLSLKFSVKY